MPEHLHSATPREAPKFPVINAEPTAGAVIANFALYDYGRMLFVTTLGAAWGFAGGAPLRRHGFWFVAGMGLMISSFASYKESRFRLTGYYPNPKECSRAGIV